MGRDESTLHPEMSKRWELARAEYAAKYPNDPQPFLTQTLRTFAEQEELYKIGRSKPGKRVTNAHGGQSLHNYGLAFDIAFTRSDGKLVWEPLQLFRNFATIAKRYGLSWGGSWLRFKDYPHFEPPKFTWHDAANHKIPTFPPLPVVAE